MQVKISLIMTNVNLPENKIKTILNKITLVLCTTKPVTAIPVTIKACKS